MTTIFNIPSPSDTATANEDGSLRYMPGKSRSHHLEMMMSKEELEEEQRSVHPCCSLQHGTHSEQHIHFDASCKFTLATEDHFLVAWWRCRPLTSASSL